MKKILLGMLFMLVLVVLLVALTAQSPYYNSIWTRSLVLRPHAVATGDSVLGRTFLRSTDSVIVCWSGSAWVTVKDLNTLR